jgi:hypothetical protein
LHAESKNRLESFKAVAGIIDGLKQKGYDFVTISELLAVEESISALNSSAARRRSSGV